VVQTVKSACSIISLDQTKAFNRVDWTYLSEILSTLALGVPLVDGSLYFIRRLEAILLLMLVDVKGENRAGCLSGLSIITNALRALC
jgi:hypothetical protein